MTCFLLSLIYNRLIYTNAEVQDVFLLNVVFVPLEINSVPYLDFTEYCYKECIVSDKDFIERLEKYFKF